MRRSGEKKRRSKAGVTLVEVMLAGAMLVLACTCMINGFMFAARLAHEENGMALAADGYAMDAAWTLLNGSKNAWPLNTEIRNQIFTISNAVPVLANSSWPAPHAYITITNGVLGTGQTLAAGKAISVNVVWGPSGERRQLWGDINSPLESDVTIVYDRNHSREVFKAIDIDRGESEVE